MQQKQKVNFLKQLFFSAAVIFSFLATGHYALAQSGGGGPIIVTDCVGTIENGICVPTTGLPDGKIIEILSTLMLWLLSIVGILAIIAFVISGIQYMTAVGDPKQAGTAKSNMLYAIIGILVALSGIVLIQAISTLLTAQTTTF